MTVTKAEAQMLTTLALSMRPAGAPRWEAPGVMAALAKVAHVHLADVTMAVARAASDRTLQTPGPIGNLKSPCWVEKVAESTAPRHPHARDRLCWTCSRPLSETCCDSPSRKPEKGAPRPEGLR